MEQWQVGPVPEYIYGNSSNHPGDIHAQHQYQQHLPSRRNDMEFRSYAPAPQAPNQQHHQAPVPPPPMNVAQHAAQQHAQQHSQPPHATPQQPPSTAAPPAASTPAPQRSRKRPNPATATAPATSASPIIPPPVPSAPSVAAPASGAPPSTPSATATSMPAAPSGAAGSAANPGNAPSQDDSTANPTPPPAKKSRTNTPWTPAEEHRLKQMRDAGSSWADIAKTFPTRTEGSVKKHWYKDMHYAEFAEDESVALLNAIKEYENQKWKVIGQKVGKPAKACEQYAKEHFGDQSTSTIGKR